jgi:uncharacterized membrane protein
MSDSHTHDREIRGRIRLFFPPITIALVCIPLVFQLIPRNRVYGFRTSTTMASDAAWYPANQTGGLVFVGACLLWMVAAAYAPRRAVGVIGMVLLLLALFVWYLVSAA